MHFFLNHDFVVIFLLKRSFKMSQNQRRSGQIILLQIFPFETAKQKINKTSFWGAIDFFLLYSTLSMNLCNSANFEFLFWLFRPLWFFENANIKGLQKMPLGRKSIFLKFSLINDVHENSANMQHMWNREMVWERWEQMVWERWEQMVWER